MYVILESISVIMQTDSIAKDRTKMMITIKYQRDNVINHKT